MNCSLSKTKNPWDLNYPIISVAFGASESSNSDGFVIRTVTYVSGAASSNKVSIINHEGVTVPFDPEELKFKEKGDIQSYKINKIDKVL